MQISEIKEKLEKGDFIRIAKATSLSVSLVRKILNGYRVSESDNSKRILIAARIIVNQKNKTMALMEASVNN